MKFYRIALTFYVALSSWLHASAPESPQMQDYEKLLERSPFIIKKPAAAPVVKVNTSLTLRGVAALNDGWYVVVVDRKNPKQNIILREGRPANANGIRLVKVNQDKTDYNKTTVVVMSGGRSLTIGYNSADIKKSLAAAKPPVKKVVSSQRTPASNRPPIPTTASQSNAQPKTNSSGRRPRVRRTTTPPPVPRTQ